MRYMQNDETRKYKASYKDMRVALAARPIE